MANKTDLNADLATELHKGVKCIALFTYYGKDFFVVDYKENFILDMQKEVHFSYEKGRISYHELEEELSSTYYRDGIWQLDENSVDSYLENSDILIASMDEMRGFLFCGMMSDDQLKDKSFVNTFISKFPMFYINFDQKVFRHQDYGRFHQDYAYDWDADECELEELVPESSKYWVRDSINYWQLLNKM